MTEQAAQPGLPPGVMVVNGAQLHADVRALIEARNVAAVTTLLPSGQPQTQVTWIDLDASHLLVNTLVFAQKFRNIQRDPRITVLVLDHDDPEHYVEVRGHVVDVVGGEPAVEHVERLARLYAGTAYRGPQQRVIWRVEPTRQVIRRAPRR